MKRLIAGTALGLTALVGVTASAQAAASSVGAATGRVGDAPSEGGPVTASHFDCSDNADGNYPDPNDSSGYIACVAREHAYAMPCAQGHNGQRLFYVVDSGPNEQTSRCDYREVTGAAPTLTAGTLRTPGTPGTPGTLKALTATMELHGQPVEAARITFTDDKGHRLCEAYTDNQGVATCNTLPDPSSNSFTARFAGGSANPEEDGGWQAADAVGGLA